MGMVLDIILEQADQVNRLRREWKAVEPETPAAKYSPEFMAYYQAINHLHVMLGLDGATE